MANKITGDIEFFYNDNKIFLKPTFGALAEIENDLNLSLFKIIEQFNTKGLLLNQQKIIFFYGLKYAGFNFSTDQVNDIICSIGTIKSTEYCLKFIEEFFLNNED